MNLNAIFCFAACDHGTCILIYLKEEPVRTLFFSSHLLSSPFFLSLLSIINNRNCDPGSHSRLFSLFRTTVCAFHFYSEKT